MVSVEEYNQKTTFIKGFIPLKAILESPRVEEKKGFIIKKSEFAETVEAFRGDLVRQLSNEEIEKLKLLDIICPSYGIILLPPELKYPLVGFNLDNTPLLFEKSGWLFHATTDLALNSCAQDGFLLSPFEMIFEKKDYLSYKFESDKFLERLKWEIPFAFQNVTAYQSYIRRIDKHTTLGFGGFFVFPVNSVLVEDSILQFGGVDGFPEIDLLDPAQSDWIALIDILISLKKNYDSLLNNFSRSERFFVVCKENLEKLRIIVEAQRRNQVKVFSDSETIFFLRTGTNFLNSIEENKRTFALMQQEMGTERYTKFISGLRASYDKGEEKKYQRYAQILSQYSRRANKSHYMENSLLSGNDEFFRFINNFARDETLLAHLLKSIEEDDFFTFLLFTNNFYFKPNDVVPVYSTYSQQNAPTFLKGTIFHSHLTSYINTSIHKEHQVGMFMLVELQKKSGRISPDVVDYAKKLKPSEIKKLIESTRNEVIKSIEVIVPISRKARPIKVSIRDGVLFLTRTWYYTSRNRPILRNLIQAGVPILIGFEADQNNHIREEEIIHVTHNVLGARDLPVLESYRSNQGYLFGRISGTTKEIWYKNDNQEFRVI